MLAFFILFPVSFIYIHIVSFYEIKFKKMIRTFTVRCASQLILIYNPVLQFLIFNWNLKAELISHHLEKSIFIPI